MFTYFHCYTPDTWQGQIDAGLINKNSGVRLVMTVRLDEKDKFNEIAKKDGALFKMVTENKMPFYIDRLQGGDFLFDYPYDFELVDEYKKALGDRFYGFQMHEWLSNLRTDLKALKKIPDDKWNAEEIERDVFSKNPYPYLNLSAMSARELAEFRPKNIDDFLRVGEQLFAKRQRYTNGELLPCDSFFLTYPLELENGAKRIFAEIGAQTPNTLIQVSFLRGMTKMYGVEFGTYYESWGGIPFSESCYQREGKNEWNIVDSAEFPFKTMGDNGGSSRSMQLRMHLFSYMSGASFISEEWGLCNTFYDWEKFELSPYGKVKKRFLDFVDAYPDIGNPVAPVAVVLPEHFILEPAAFGQKYLNYKVDKKFAEKLKRIRKGIRRIFCASSPMFGTERSLVNCKTYAAVDIVTADCLKPETYDKLVDLTCSDNISKKYADKIIDIKNINKFIESKLPCVVSGGVMKQFTIREDGVYFVLLTNNCGITQSVKNGQQVSPFSSRTATIMPKDGYSVTVLETDATVKFKNGKCVAKMPGGSFLFAKITKAE